MLVNYSFRFEYSVHMSMSSSLIYDFSLDVVSRYCNVNFMIVSAFIYFKVQTISLYKVKYNDVRCL